MKPPLRCAEGFIYDNRDDLICDTALFADAHYIVAAVNACHAAGLTVEQLEGGDVIAAAVAAEREAIAKMVEDDPNSCETCGLGGPPDWRAEWIAEKIRKRGEK